MNATKPDNESHAKFFMKSVASASMAASIGEALTIPFDTAKVIKQVESKAAGDAPSKYGGLVSTLRVVAAEEGVGALFNGLTAGL
jgi:solute carrier family 25 uncoupling protein 8/9